MTRQRSKATLHGRLDPFRMMTVEPGRSYVRRIAR